MKRTSLPLLAACAILLLTLACSRRATGTPYLPPSSSPGPSAGGVPLSFDSVSDTGMDYQNFHPQAASLRTNAHATYLGDPLKFQALPDQGVSTARTAVVGSRVCRFYPDAAVSKDSDLAKLSSGLPVPFGTILPIQGDPLRDVDKKEQNGMFEFQDNWNWFYRTSFQGKTGIVFGADLFGLDDSPAENRVSARLYQTGGKLDSFYPVTGYRPLSAAITAKLEAEKLAFQKVDPSEYYLSFSRPDDMISLYQELRAGDYGNGWNRKQPVFVSTDLAAHAQHLVFDRLLQDVEEASFVPRLMALDDAFIAKLSALKDGASTYQETWQKALLYFQVDRALLDLAPIRMEKDDEYGHPDYVYQERNEAAVLASYPQEVRDEIAKMDRAAGFEPSAVFTFSDGTLMKEDYSQYKPRGHYTKNGVLSAYFRAMMWFGRIHFLIAMPGIQPLERDGSTSSDSTELTLKMEPIALLFTDLVKGDPELYRQWSDLFDPITALIGLSDDLSFEDVLPLWKEQGVKDFGAWTSSREKLLSFMKLAHEKLRPPAISGSSVFWGPSEGPDRKPPMGWRLFGQRFTYDSAVHEEVSPPRLRPRDMVRGLDIMKAFGSEAADAFLASSDYPEMEGLEERLDGIEKEFSSYGEDFWNRTYYNEVLYEVKSQAQFGDGPGYYFSQSPAWAVKALLSAHGTWAELRHDTLLYVKQVYAERAGDGDFNPTFRTEPIPDPVHYIEPNLPFWQEATLSAQDLAKTLARYGLLDGETANSLKRLQQCFARAASIAALEAADKPVPKGDIAWIPTFPAELASVVMLHMGDGEVDEDQLKMACIADVYTNAELEKVLETAVGIPYRLYIPLNDGQGGKRIAVGYGFSYYEFRQSQSDRMTDEQWKGIVYGTAPLGDYEPFWAKGIALQPEAAKK